MKKQNEPMSTANVKYKSSVFSLLFSDPVILRELYSAIEGIELPPDIPIGINTLSNALVLGKLNDLSFAIDNRLVVLVEQQSTINANMPFRMLEYIDQVYKGITDSSKMFQRNLVKIPKPEFIVLYNGIEKFEEYKELRLSDAFMDIEGLKEDGKAELTLELVVKVYNINLKHNPGILKKSKTLWGYSVFVNKVREYKNSGKELAEAIELAVKYCLENGILKDFMEAHSQEVQKMLYEEYTLEDQLEVLCDEAREEGREEGEARGAAKERRQILDLIAQGLSPEELKQRLEQS